MIRVRRQGMVRVDGVLIGLRSNELIALERGERVAVLHRRYLTPWMIVGALWRLWHR